MSKNDFRKESLIKHYEKCLKTMINDLDFQRFFGQENDYKVMKYSDLANYQDINDLLSEPIDYRIILTETKRNVGHWCALMKYGDTIEWFDSYGGKSGVPDGELEFVSYAMRKMLGELKPLLSNLLKTKFPKQQLFYNKHKFRQLADGIDTCGRWVICRVLMMKLGYNLPEFIDFVERHSKDTGKPPDILVCDWIV